MPPSFPNLEYRARLGYLPQDFGYYPEFSGQDFLMYLAALKGLYKKTAQRKVKELLELVSLTEVSKKKIKTYPLLGVKPCRGFIQHNDFRFI